MPEENKKSEEKVLDQETLEKELTEFLKVGGFNPDDPNLDMEKLQAGFIQYLKDQGYHLTDGIVRMLSMDQMGRVRSSKTTNIPKKIRYISERLNRIVMGLDKYTDTTRLLPGSVCYTIAKIEPTAKKPWVTYVPSARVIAQIHDSGVNGGTVFLSYQHKVVHSGQFEKAHQIVSEDEVFYSPLTKEHATYICKLLNVQSKNAYIKEKKRLIKEVKQKLNTVKKQSKQNVK